MSAAERVAAAFRSILTYANKEFDRCKAVPRNMQLTENIGKLVGAILLKVNSPRLRNRR